MSDAPKYTTLRDYLRVVREQRILIVLIVLVFAGAAVALSERAKPVYEARASLAFHSPNDDFRLLGAAVGATQTPEAQAASASQSIRTISVAREAAKELKPGIAPEVLLDHITVRAEVCTNFVDVSAKARTAQRAADEANAFAHAARRLVIDNDRRQYSRAARDLIRQNKTLSRRPVNNFTRGANADRINRLKSLAKFALPVTIEVPASPADSPISPKPVRNTLLGLLLGLTIALLVAPSCATRWTAASSPRARSPRRCTCRCSATCPRACWAARWPTSRAARRSRRPSSRASGSCAPTSSSSTSTTRSSSVLVTSALPEEGKSTLVGACAGLRDRGASARCSSSATCAARRWPSGSASSRAPGLTDYLAGQATPGARSCRRSRSRRSRSTATVRAPPTPAVRRIVGRLAGAAAGRAAALQALPRLLRAGQGRLRRRDRRQLPAAVGGRHARAAAGQRRASWSACAPRRPRATRRAPPRRRWSTSPSGRPASSSRASRPRRGRRYGYYSYAYVYGGSS